MKFYANRRILPHPRQMQKAYLLHERVQPTSPARALVIVVVTHGAIEPLGSGIRPQPLDGSGIRRPDNTTLSKSLEASRGLHSG